MNLEKLIESHFAPKKGNDLLIQLIEQRLGNSSLIFEAEEQGGGNLFYGDERTLKLPIIRFSKNIGRKNTYDRNFLDLVVHNLKNISGKDGELLQTRIASFQKFFNGNFEGELDISNIISYCMISEAFYHLINDYDASTAGDLFEPLFAALFDGTIVEAPEGKRNYAVEDVQIASKEGQSQELKDVSLKLLSPGGGISQNYKNILEKLVKSGGILYVVAYKERQSNISFYALDLTPNNILETVTNISKLVGGERNLQRALKINKTELAQKMLNDYLNYKEELESLEGEIKSIENKMKNPGEYYPGTFRKEYEDLLFQKAQIEREYGRPTSIEINSTMVKRKGFLLGTFSYDKDTLSNTLQGYTNIINDRIKNIYDSLTILNNSINDFFLKGQGKDEKLAVQAIKNTRAIEDNLRKQFEKKIIVRE